MTHGLRHFGDFTFDSTTGELTRNGRRVHLERQPSLALDCLVCSGGRLVTRQELAAAIWPEGTHVNFDDGVNYCVRQLRTALADDAKAPRFIETLPRRGYRFVAPVSIAAEASVLRGRVTALATAAATVAVWLLWVESGPNTHHELAVRLARSIHHAIF